MSQQINLFNPVFLKQKKYFSLLAMVQSLGLIAVGAALFYAYATWQSKEMSRQFADSNKRYAVEQERMERFSAEFAPQQTAQLLQEELKQTEAQLNAQHATIEALKSGAVGNTSGYSEYMRAFARQIVHGVWLTGFKITGEATQMSVSGAVLYPELLPAYIQKLNHERVMRGTTFATLQMQLPSTEAEKSARYVEFTLQSDVTPGASPGVGAAQ